MTTRMVRLTASVPKDIAEEADQIATSRGLSRSKLISECLRELIEARKSQLLRDGYKAMAKAHEEFARLSEDAAREALPPWKSR